MRSNPRTWLVAGGAAAALILVVGWFLLISPQRSATADLHAQSADARVAQAELQHRLGVLTSQNAQLPQYQAALTQDQLALPRTDGMSDFLRSLQRIGTASLVHITAMTVGTPTVQTPPTGVYGLPITMDASGSISQLMDFLTQLQTVQPRAVLISQVDQKAASTRGAVTLSLTMQAFVSSR